MWVMKKILLFLLVSIGIVSPFFGQEDTILVKELIKMDIKELLNMTVYTASKKAEKVNEVPASSITITRKEIEFYGWKSLTQILANIPGIYVIDQHKWSGMTGFGVRGFFTEGSFSNLVVLVNGSLVSKEGYINQYIIDRIGVSVESIEKIEVVRGPMAVMYGNGAFFGAINIITSSEKEPSRSLVNASYGTDNTQRTSFRLANKLDEFTYSFNTTLSHTNGIDIPYTSMTSNPDVLLNGTEVSFLESVGKTNSATTGHLLHKDMFNVNMCASQGDFGFSVNHTNVQKGLIWSAPAINTNENNVRIVGTDAQLDYKNKISPTFSFFAKYAYGSYNSTSRYSILDANFYGQSVIMSANSSLEAYLQHQPHDNITLTLGVLRDCMLHASNDVDIPTYNVANSSWRIKLGESIRNYDAYTQFTYNPTDNLRLVAGIRASLLGDYNYQRIIDHGLSTEKVLDGTFTDNHAHLSYNAAVIWQPVTEHTFKLLYGTAISSPNMRQNVTSLDIAGAYRATLEPSTIATLELNYRSAIGDMSVFSFSVFRNKLDRLIESSGALSSTGTYEVYTRNSGMILTHGVEADLKYLPHKNIALSLGSVYQQSENLKPGYKTIELGYSPPLLVYFKAHYNYSWFSAGLSANYVDGMHTSWQAFGIDPTNGTRYGSSVPGYTNVNLNLRANNLLGKELYAEVYVSNLLNQEILYATDPSNKWADKGLPGPTRSMLLTLGKRF